MSEIKFTVTVDSKTGEASLKRLDKSVGRLPATTKKASTGFSGLWKQIAAGTGLSLGIAGAVRLISQALKGLVRWTGEAIERSAAQQAVEKRLEAVLRSTSEAAGLNKKELLDMASALQEVTTYGDETIIGAQNLLLTFTRIGKEVFPDALEIVMDMSTALGVDLKQSAISVGKALNDPILGVTALRRVGVSFTEQQQEQIKTLVKSGDVLSAQNLILKELRVEFGGMSRAAVETYEGAVAQLKNTYGDLQEEIGATVTENEDLRDMIKLVTQSMRDLIDSGYLEYLLDLAKETAKNVEYFIPFADTLKIIAMRMSLSAAESRALKKEQERLAKIAEDYHDKLKLLDEEKEVSIKATMDLTERTEELFDIWARAGELPMPYINWEALKPPSELLEEWDRLFSLVETPELDLQWEQFEQTADEAFANVMESMGFFVRETEGYADDYTVIMKGMTEAQKEFAAVALGEFMAMEASLEGFVGAILGSFEKWAIGQIIPKIMEALPFPINLLAVGAAVLFIKTWFAKIRGLEEGGWVGMGGPEIVKVGERGPEYVVKSSDTKNFFDQRARKIDITIIVQDQLDPFTAQRIVRGHVIPQILEALDVNEEKKKWQDRLGIE